MLTEKRITLDKDTGREHFNYEIVDIQVEEPYRALAQLRTLGRALARIHGRSCVTDHETELLRRVVLSSVLPVRSEALACFRCCPLGLTASGLADRLECSDTWARNLLKELTALSLVSEMKGAAEWTYRPNPELAELITKDMVVLHHIKDLALCEESHSQNSPHTNSSIDTPAPVPVGSLV